MQAYTSQFVALIMFALMMSEDRLSLQKRRLEIIDGLRILPGQSSQIRGKREGSDSVAPLGVCPLRLSPFFFFSQFESFSFTRAD